jgi:hypothetical protein
MADHIRKQIRDAAKAALTGLTTTGTNVFSGRVSLLKPTEMPGLLVFLNGDDGQEDAYVDGPTEMFAGTLRIEAIAAANDDTIDVLDQIAVEVEAALFADTEFLALLMVTPSPPSTTIIIDEPIEGAARRLGSIAINFPIQYRTRLGDPSTQV